MNNKCIKGKILTEKGFKKGYILIKQNEKPEIHLGSTQKKTTHKNLIIPTFINAHTHIGDTFIREKNIKLPRDIIKLVAPPDGLKHKLLKKTDQKEIKQGIIYGLKELEKNGISTFVDFRENGIKGINILKKSLKKINLSSIILGRPEKNNPTKKEIVNILKNSDGIGLSSVIDLEYDIAEKISIQTKKENKILAFHVSERIREKIKPILKLKPDYIVHMTKASKKDILQVKKKDIPIIICPRSNYFFGLKPKLEQIKKIGNTFFIGTDNFMLNSPSIIDEIKFIQKKFPNLFSIEELLIKNTYEARKYFNLKDNIPGSSIPNSWIILDQNNLQIKSIFKNVQIG